MFSIYQPRPYCVSQCFFITFSILGGAIYFRELEAFTWQQWVVFLLSLCVTLLGVIVLSLRMGGNSKPAVSMGAPSPSPLKEGNNANAKEGNNFRDNATLTGDKNSNLTGNDQDNRLSGNSGQNVLDGQGGNDTAVFRGASGEYKIEQSGDGIAVEDSVSGRDGSVTLRNIEELQFSDRAVSADQLN